MNELSAKIQYIDVNVVIGVILFSMHLVPLEGRAPVKRDTSDEDPSILGLWLLTQTTLQCYPVTQITPPAVSTRVIQ